MMLLTRSTEGEVGKVISILLIMTMMLFLLNAILIVRDMAKTEDRWDSVETDTSWGCQCKGGGDTNANTNR